MPILPRKQSQTVTTAIASHATRLEGVRFPDAIKLPSDPARRDNVLTVFGAVLNTRTRDDWDGVALIHAARLATLLMMQAEGEAQLLEEGLLIDTLNAAGCEVKAPNPLTKALANTNGLLVAAMRALGLSAIDARQIRATAKHAGGALVATQGVSGDDVDWSKQ
jgi:hypothetical protein